MELEQILAEVAAGKLPVPEAAVRIRQLFNRPRPRPIGPGGPRGFQRQPLGVALIFAAVGTICVVAAVVVGTWRMNFAAGAAHTEGTVLRLVATDQKGSRAPVIRYEVDGKAYEFQSSISSNPPNYAVGQKVAVLYQPDNPGAGTIDSFFERWFMPILLGVFGVVFSAIGYGMIVVQFRQAMLPPAQPHLPTPTKPPTPAIPPGGQPPA